MAEPFALRSGDPLFDPREPVTVNGFLYIPAAAHDRRVSELLEANNREVERRRAAGIGAKIWQIIKTLTEGEGDALTVICPNPDWNGQPNHAIECCGGWTGWEPRRFAHDDRRECFRMALAAFERWNQSANPGGAHEVATHPQIAGQGPGAEQPDGVVPTSGPAQGVLEQ